MVEKRNWWLDILVWLGLSVIIIANFLPLLWGALASFKPVSQLVTYPPNLFGFEATTQNYQDVFEGNFMTGVKNSLLYGIAAVTISLSIGSLAAFGFDRFRFKGHGLAFLVIVASIPLAMGAAALLVPKFLFFTKLGLSNQWYTLPLIYAVHTMPLTIWILKGAMEGIPRELDEAAYVDGASAFTVFWRIVMPLCLPAIGAAGLLVFIHAWNEFLAGSIMVDAAYLKPIQPLLYQYIGFFGREWGLLLAAATIAILPILVIYALFGRLLVSGLTHGATKG
jgi:multiple sugar transport system permease protein